MIFQDFLDNIPKIGKESLPGEVAHIKMAPPERIDAMRQLDMSQVHPRNAAVMMLVYPKENLSHIALILRNTYNGVHSSQIAFPGGKEEPEDISLEHAALRETQEEVGIQPDLISVVRPFTNVYIPPSNFMVYPFLGYCLQTPQFIPDPAEVAGIIEMPLVDFLNDESVVQIEKATSYSKVIKVPAFKIGEHLIWGATAMILSELKEVLKTVS